MASVDKLRLSELVRVVKAFGDNAFLSFFVLSILEQFIRVIDVNKAVFKSMYNKTFQR
jgi:hypothetical protein